LAGFLVAVGVVDDISHEGLRPLLREDSVSFQRVKTWKVSGDPDFKFCRYLRGLYPPGIRIAIVLDNFSPHPSTRKDARASDWTAADNVEFAYTPTNSSWLNRIEARFTAPRYFTLDGTDHASHEEQSSMIRRYIICRNKYAADERLREIVNRANVA
jgi:hypothetical protein